MCGFDVHAGFDGIYGSVVYSKQCLLVWSCVEERGWSFLRRALDFEVEGLRQKGRLKRWKGQVEEESVMVGLRREDALC